MPKVALDVIIRTHTGPNLHGGTRVAPFPKDVLILGCFRSILRSARDARDVADVKITVIDDHSIPSLVDTLKREGVESGIPCEIISLPADETGFYASAHTAYLFARTNARELVYFVEDDYVHRTEALREMLEARALFTNNLGGLEVGIFPVDYPDNYDPRWFLECRVVIGPNGHWRTNTYTTGTHLVSKKLLIAQWDKFSSFALYGVAPEIHEGSTIDRIWLENHAVLFSPLRSLAIHLQFKENIPAFVDWQEWWRNYTFPQDK